MPEKPTAKTQDQDIEEDEIPTFADMSLRDHFAAAALPILVKLWVDTLDGEDAARVAHEAYRIADAMMKERDRKEE